MRGAALFAHRGGYRQRMADRVAIMDHGKVVANGDGGRAKGRGRVVIGAGVYGGGGKEHFMIRATFWKEWRETSPEYGAYWVALNLPYFIPALCVAVSKTARAPFADLNDATALKYLGLAMVVECYAVLTVFMLMTGFLARPTFQPGTGRPLL